MEKQIITFSANEQKLIKTGGIDCYASNTVAYIEAHFDLGENWDGYDSVRAVWYNDYNKTVATVLDSDGTCIVPYEVLTRKSAVKVNLVGSIADGDVLTDRLTTCPVVALTIKCNAKTDGDNAQPITPSQFEQFVQDVKADVDKAETARNEAEAARDVAVSAKDTAVNAVEGFEDTVDIATATAVQTIQGEGTTQVTAVQEKGDEVLDSIPTDYTQLSQDVTDLKSEINNRIPWTTHDIFTLQGAVEGEYVQGSDGGIYYNQYVGHTDYIDVSSYVSLTLAFLADTGGHVRTYQGAFYDSNKNHITGYSVSGVTTDREYVVDVPSNAQYFIFDYVLIRKNDYYIKAITKISRRTPVVQHFYFTGKEPYFNTQNRTLTFYASCPFVVNGKAYGNQKNTNTVINIPVYQGDIVHYIICLDLINSSETELAFEFISANRERISPNMAYVGQINVASMIFSFPFNVNVDGTKYYALGAEVFPRLGTLESTVNNISVIDCEYQTYSGGYVQASDGTVVSNNQTGYTSYIDVSAFSTMRCPIDHTSTYQMAFYDADKTFVSGARKSATAPYVWDILVPTNAKYARLSFYLDVENIFYAKGFIDDLQAFVKSFNSDNDKFSQMKMNCLGDSITYGYIPDSGAQMANPYPSELKNILGLAECRNYGISGSTLAVNSGNYQPMCLRYADMSDDADIVLVFGGTNDYGRGVYTPTLGTINDSVNTTVYGALNILCEGLITKYPKAFIFLCTPLKRADKTGANGGGYTLEDVANAIREVGLKFGMPVLDLDAKGGFYISNATFRAQYGGNDKLHPNQAFDNEHLAPMIARFIESNM